MITRRDLNKQLIVAAGVAAMGLTPESADATAPTSVPNAKNLQGFEVVHKYVPGIKIDPKYSKMAYEWIEQMRTEGEVQFCSDYYMHGIMKEHLVLVNPKIVLTPAPIWDVCYGYEDKHFGLVNPMAYDIEIFDTPGIHLKTRFFQRDPNSPYNGKDHVDEPVYQSIVLPSLTYEQQETLGLRDKFGRGERIVWESMLK
jgi:hypothetical protein